MRESSVRGIRAWCLAVAGLLSLNGFGARTGHHHTDLRLAVTALVPKDQA